MTETEKTLAFEAFHMVMEKVNKEGLDLADAIESSIIDISEYDIPETEDGELTPDNPADLKLAIDELNWQIDLLTAFLKAAK